MKKKLLFVIPSLEAGGAEKSLVNLLNIIDSEKYEVDLLLFSQKGLFLSQVPEFVKKLELNRDLQVFQMLLSQSLYSFLKQGKPVLANARFQYFLENRRNPNTAVAEQNSWKWLSKAIQPPAKEYDAAISFLEKTSSYFVAEKVNAGKKIAWIHTDYEKSGLNAEFDQNFFEKFNHIVTISEQCKKSLEKSFPKSSVKLIENISSAQLITKLSNEEIQLSEKPIRFLTVARLSKEKGIDIAVETARVLKEKSLDFEWLVIGEGPERNSLEKLIAQYGLSENFKLMGLRKNPYPYLKDCIVYVQPSRCEGKSIAIDEALILGKPIVVTNFSTAKDQISDRETGLIAEMNRESLAEKILELLNDGTLSEHLLKSLSESYFSNEQEVGKFYALING